MGLIYFREMICGLTVNAHGVCEQDTKFEPQRVPGPQLPIRSRVEGSQFTTPIDLFRFFLVMNYWESYMVLQMYILKKKKLHT